MACMEDSTQTHQQTKQDNVCDPTSERQLLIEVVDVSLELARPIGRHRDFRGQPLVLARLIGPSPHVLAEPIRLCRHVEVPFRL